MIDLGTADTLTACFNNGSGNWDSNNGSNYKFKAGIYTYQSGIISEIGDSNAVSENLDFSVNENFILIATFFDVANLIAQNIYEVQNVSA